MRQSLTRVSVVMPVVYMFFAIFVLRGAVQYVYAATAALVVLTMLSGRWANWSKDEKLGRWLAVLGAIGVAAATILSVEKIELLKDPNHTASCSLSPIVACSPVIASDQASAFGLPNSFIGIFGFACVLTAGMTLAAGAVKLHKLWWLTLNAAAVAGVVFCIWLFHEGVYEIGKLCLYCMLVWMVTAAIFWLVTAHNVAHKRLNLGRRLNVLTKYTNELIVSSYIVIFVLLFLRWQEYWLSLL